MCEYQYMLRAETYSRPQRGLNTSKYFSTQKSKQNIKKWFIFVAPWDLEFYIFSCSYKSCDLCFIIYMYESVVVKMKNKPGFYSDKNTDFGLFYIYY